MKENKTSLLKKLFKEKIGKIPCDVKYDPRNGWMVIIEGGYWSIVGDNYVQARAFINRFDWIALMKAAKWGREAKNKEGIKKTNTDNDE